MQDKFQTSCMIGYHLSPQLLSCSHAKVPKLVIQKLTGVPFLSLIYSSRFRVRSGVVTVHRTFSKVAMHINSFTAIGASQSFGKE